MSLLPDAPQRFIFLIAQYYLRLDTKHWFAWLLLKREPHLFLIDASNLRSDVRIHFSLPCCLMLSFMCTCQEECIVVCYC